ncbi:cupin fold metalloprotein, WbuC family [Paramagnetospirillum kuznetsovii]|uniref:Cupin fold metalloprotein, WbuC family n=1 Tax=Paramagnetospirillum kuznetsovii TaxID=2053833 RepID=A0A364NXW1_9PROT|nr:WbuC family cupin fold metalloprotein [Paramagnetospirillum kuznetsovii]RAU21883.1 cupin fold metalloprotein, WbuC family [Paramagnetospirillum kuznetsovii]
MKLVDPRRLSALVEQARTSPRRRAHLNIHDDTAESINRLAIALEPDTYIRPHRHSDKFELFVLLVGRAVLIGFDGDGVVTERVEVGGEGTRIAEFPVGTWHSLVALDSGSIMLEVKPGPYSPTPEADFAAWAPAEGDAAAAACRDWLQDHAVPGLRWPGQFT